MEGSDQSAEKEQCKERLDMVGLFFYGLLLVWLISLVASILQGRTHLWYVIGAMAFFLFVNLVVETSLLNNGPLLSKVPKNLSPLFINTSVSFIHSTIVSLSGKVPVEIIMVGVCSYIPLMCLQVEVCGDLKALVVTGLLFSEVKRTGIVAMFSHEELFNGLWQGADYVLCFSCGYFAYDQWDMLYRHLYKPRAPSLLIHHAILLACFTMALYRSVAINYLILTLVCELHSVFLHLRRVLLMAGLRQPGTRLVLLEWSLNCLAFFITRLLMHIIITIKLLHDASKFPPGIELPLALFGMAGLHVLNIILGLDLLKAYKRERSGRKNSRPD